MNEFQEQAKNWLRNVVKQNPDKIKAGVAKAGDLIDQQTGGKYAAKVDAVQEKVGTFVDSQTGETAAADNAPQATADDTAGASEDAAGAAEDAVGAQEDAAGAAEDTAGAEEDAAPADPASWTVGGEVPDAGDAASAGSSTAGAETGGTATGLPGPRE
ncbi:antitoxin [Kribbella sp. NPDC051587]|uniref:antitoxin n=1 Tax=Kribbella sp. NPDC051587 TaxID=3364119 RepID=UPI0037BC30E3